MTKTSSPLFRVLPVDALRAGSKPASRTTVDRWLGALALLFALAGLGFPMRAVAAATSAPAINSIHLQAGNVVVSVSIPSGLAQVTLESRSRFGAGAWVPAVVLHTDGSATNVDFTLPPNQSFQALRVMGNPSTPLPGTFYQGTNQFTGLVSASDPSSAAPGATLTAGSPVTTTANTASTAPVAESDVWEFSGNTLYFFNQQRGLQIIDITDPTAPVLLSTLPLPAVGEQMYLLDTNHVVLLAQNNCGNGDSNNVLVVQVTGGVPVVQSQVSLEGSWSDSRMVGSILYMASQAYYPVASTNGEWVWGTVVSSVDLSNPANPVVADTRTVDGYGNLVYATDDYFFVTTSDYNYYDSTVYPFDISDGTGALTPLSPIQVSGMVESKYNLNYQEGVFSVVATLPDDSNWDYWTTSLVNYDVAANGSFAREGSLVLARGNQLESSVFDGSKAYIVTGDQTSPLWVVDNSNPAAPVVAGEVDISGWSSFIVPLGGQLVTIGVESNLVAVSLFDVSQPSRPGLLGSVVLGDEYSWSFANWDDKSFNVLPDAGLILVPYEGYGSNGYSSQVQLIDLGSNSLALRGIISHPMQPERTAVSGDTILAISDEDLLSVDATERDEPVVNTDLQLAWDVSQVIAVGNYVAQISENDPGAPTLRITSTSHTATILGELVLTNLPVLGVTSHGNYAYVAQGQSPAYWFLIPVDGGGEYSTTNGYSLLLSVVDLTALPGLQIVGQAVVTNMDQGWGYSLQPLWAGTNLLVWAGNAPMFLPFEDGPVLGGGVSSLFFPWWGSGSLTAFDVSNPGTPQFDSQIQVSTNGWSFSPSWAVQNLIFTSFQTSYLITNAASSNSVGSVSNAVPPGSVYWITQNSLQVIDFSDPLNPTPRIPAPIPNPLIGVSPDGSTVYTEGPHLNPQDYYDWSQIYLDAGAYDGAAVYALDSIPLTNGWPLAWVVSGTNVLVASPGATSNAAPGELDLWSITPAGKFALRSSLGLSEPLESLQSFSPGWVLGQGTDSSLFAFDLTGAPGMRLAVQTNLDSCLWFSLSAVAGSPTAGLWVPFGSYGLAPVNLTP